MRLGRPLTLALTLTPLPVISAAVKVIFSRVISAHPRLFDRLGDYANKKYRFVLTDFPLAFLICPAQKSIKIDRRRHTIGADAQIEGSLAVLLLLAEGGVDADALFFSRDLSVTGDMEAMVALRNALDDSRLNLPYDLATFCGPLAEPVEYILVMLRKHMTKRTEEQWN